MQVILKITDLPFNSAIGPNFNVVLTPAGSSTPSTVTLSQLTSVNGVLINVPDNTTNISLVSTGVCINAQDVEIPCVDPLKLAFQTFFNTTQDPTPIKLRQFLDLGYLFNGCIQCESECNPYLLSSFLTYIAYNNSQTPYLCCHKGILSLETWLKYAEAVGDTDPG